MIPSRDDPRRPLFFAVRNLTTLAALLFAIGMFGWLPVLARGKWWSGAIVAVILVSPGTALFVIAVMVRQRRQWAVISGIALTSLISLGLLMLIFKVIVSVGPIDLARGKSFGGVLMLALLGLFLLLNAKAAYRLSLSFPALNLPDLTDRGFEPILAVPAQPVVSAEAVNDDAPAAG